MCRLFAMSGGPARLSAEFWLLDASDSLSVQSRRDPDGTGLGTFNRLGAAVVDKAPISAFDDTAFTHEARRLRSRTFLAHIRFATTGARTVANTHPFEQEGRLFAHNGAFSELATLEAHLGPDRSLVHGETDSERLFALITREVRARSGDMLAGLDAALHWVVENLPVYALNLILTTESDLYALRYPDTHTLYVLERAAGGHRGGQALDHHSSLGTRVHSDDGTTHAVTVFASEPTDDEPGWRLLAPGELIHVDQELKLRSTILLPGPPAFLLTSAELDERARVWRRAG
jgi:glutamine amidotransferase